MEARTKVDSARAFVRLNIGFPDRIHRLLEID